MNVNSLAVIGCACCIWLVSGCGKAADPPEVKQADQPSQVVAKQEDPAPEGPIRFTAVARDWGVAFRHVSGTTADKATPTANGSGVSVLDFDNDGLMDLYFAQSTPLPVDPKAGHTGMLFRQSSAGHFQDVTALSSLSSRTYFTHAAIAADIDNDGDTDLYLCNFGPNALLRNDGGRFTDISAPSGTDFNGWSSSAAFLDYDSDGLLDLYVSTYADWKYPEDNRFCGDQAKNVRLYCDPKELRPAPDKLFRNLGSGKFADVSAQAGINRPDGHGFGVIAADFNGDLKTDLYVANDQDPNFLFLNRGDGTFEDATAANGAALDHRGHAQAGMGVDAEDLDGDGLAEIIVTNFANEPNTLYHNLGQGLFMDVSAPWGIVSASLPHVGWGTTLTDFDMDGWPDHFVANGHLDDNRHLLGEPVRQSQPPLLFRNQNGRRFENVGAGAGPYFHSEHVGRGVAWGDLDNDGDVDLVVSHKDWSAEVLRNDSPRLGRHWLRLRLVGTASNRDAIGTRVELQLPGGRKIVRQRKGGCGLMSTHDPRLTIGLDAAAQVEQLTVFWPSGKQSRLTQVKADREWTVTEP